MQSTLRHWLLVTHWLLVEICWTNMWLLGKLDVALRPLYVVKSTIYSITEPHIHNIYRYTDSAESIGNLSCDARNFMKSVNTDLYQWFRPHQYSSYTWSIVQNMGFVSCLWAECWRLRCLCTLYTDHMTDRSFTAVVDICRRPYINRMAVKGPSVYN